MIPYFSRSHLQRWSREIVLIFQSCFIPGFWAGYNGKLRKGFLLTGKLGNWNFINWEMRIQYMVKLTGNWENDNLTGNQCTYTPFLYSVVEFYNFSFLAKAVTFYFSILKCLGYQYVEPWSLSYFTFSVAEFGRLCTPNHDKIWIDKGFTVQFKNISFKMYDTLLNLL